MEKVAAEQNLNIRFLGHLNAEELQATIRKSMFMVMPSLWYEGFPMVLLDAFSCGKPVVASRIGSLEELVDENVVGRTFEPDNAPELANTVKALLSDKQLIEKLGRSARKRFDERYSAQANLVLLTAIYKDAIATAGK
jgi:glycosyltransferase involved in cell wall biosynthesis